MIVVLIYTPTHSVLGSLSSAPQHVSLVFLMTAILTGVKWHPLRFWFVFPWWLVMLSAFSCSCWPFVCLLWKNVFLDLLPLFLIGLSVLLLSCMNSSYILHINPLSNKWFAHTFFHSVPFSAFSFRQWFLLLAGAFQSDVVTLVYFVLVTYAFGIISKESLSRPMSGKFFPMFSSRSFMVSGFTFKSFIFF